MLLMGGIVSASGCSAFDQEVAKFRVVNHQDYPLGISIDGQAEHRVEANIATEFMQEIDLATPRYGRSTTSPSLDRTTEVLVAVRNLVSKKEEASRLCQAGPKTPTNITYNGYYITCQSSYTYGGGIQNEGVSKQNEGGSK